MNAKKAIFALRGKNHSKMAINMMLQLHPRLERYHPQGKSPVHVLFRLDKQPPTATLADKSLAGVLETDRNTTV